MVSAENRIGLYVSFPLYFLILAGAALIAYRRTSNMKQKGVSDALSAHYLGGRTFGPLVTMGTLFASIYSGYTVIGIPNEAFSLGFLSLRWIVSGSGIVIGYVGTGLRLRKASLIRNHTSPVDFITDRYQSQILRYTIVFLQVVPSIIYLSAQVISVKGTFNSIFELDPDSVYPVIIIFSVILLFEWMGGLSSVAFSDAIQGMVMTLSFILIPCVIKSNFGGWKDLDPMEYPKPSFYQTPGRDLQWGFWQFAVVNLGFFSLPHLIQRTYAAESLIALKAGYMALAVSAWFTFFVGAFIGTVGVQILADAGVESPPSPFTAILEEIMEAGGFPQAVSTIAFTASLAAIMSTADSLIIAISQLITSEIIYPMNPNATPNTITWVGKAVSFCSVAAALIIGVFWDSGISSLGAVQFSVSAQTIPAFIMGLFGTERIDCHPWSLALGAMAAAISCFTLYFGYIDKVDDPAPYIHAGVTGFLINVGMTFLLESFRRIFLSRPAMDDAEVRRSFTNDMNQFRLNFPDRPGWDVPKLARFGDNPLTSSLLWKSMEGVPECLTNPWFAFFFVFLMSITTPVGVGSTPPLDENGMLSYAPGTINGIPVWAFRIIVLSGLLSAILLIVIYNIPNEYPVDEDKLAQEGIDPDLVELTPMERARRSSYDEQNLLIHRRRSTIEKSMRDLGMALTTEEVGEESPEKEEAPSADPAHQHLRDVILGGIQPTSEEQETEQDAEELGLTVNT